jgi:adenylate kinase family enzyme
MARTVIVGGPRTGKTTLANHLAADALHTDDTIGAGWDGAVERVAGWMDRPGATIEGVQTVRGLRKWLEDHPRGKPCEEVIHLTAPKVARTRGQAIMAKGCETVFKEIEPELRRRGVTIRRG